MLGNFIKNPRTAYFTMEVALRNEIPTYSGGLGVLAGDMVRSAADLEVPLVVVTLVSRKGYFKQNIDNSGTQSEMEDSWDPGQWARLLPAKISVSLESREVWIAGWLYVQSGFATEGQPVILLDTDLAENDSTDRTLTDYLYGGDDRYRLKQEVILGIGGILLLQALGFDIRQYHLNEGHSALLTLALLNKYSFYDRNRHQNDPLYDAPRVRDLCNFTTHTPVDAGTDQFSYDLIKEVLGDYIDLSTLKSLAGYDRLNMTRLALNMSEYINGVAKRHTEISSRMYPEYSMRSITNGVHAFTWTSDAFKSLYNSYLPGWCHEPELLMRVENCISDEEIWQAHNKAKADLASLVFDSCGVKLDTDIPVIGFARRMTAYKRPDLLFMDLERLKSIAAQQKFQIVLAGKAHPRDYSGKRLIQFLHECMASLKESLTVVYIPDYDIEIAARMVAGSDIWLNTPMPPLEASGTSGMKAALNGVPHFSVLDGWWLEGCIEDVTGWSIGNEDASDLKQHADSLYNKLEQIILPRYYNDQPGWIRIMKAVISKNASYFHSHRMVRRYVSEAYIR